MSDTEPTWTKDGQPETIEAALADCLEWLTCLEPNLTRILHTCPAEAQERLRRAIEAGKAFLPVGWGGKPQTQEEEKG